MAAREAQTRAQARMTRYCAGHCGALQLVHAQKIKDRWLIDFDGPGRKYTVMVDDGGNTQISVWDKSREAIGPIGGSALGEIRRQAGLAEMEALEIIDAEALQQRGILVRADPFRHRLDVEILGQADQGAHEHLVLRRLT